MVWQLVVWRKTYSPFWVSLFLVFWPFFGLPKPGGKSYKCVFHHSHRHRAGRLFRRSGVTKKSKVICHEKDYEILTRKIAVHRTRHARGTGRNHAANSSLVLHATTSGTRRLVAGRRQCQ